MNALSRDVPIGPKRAALLIVVTDACTTSSAERHDQSLLGIRGYCRECTSDQLVQRFQISNML
jgi:hypothetical protein